MAIRLKAVIKRERILSVGTMLHGLDAGIVQDKSSERCRKGHVAMGVAEKEKEKGGTDAADMEGRGCSGGCDALQNTIIVQ